VTTHEKKVYSECINFVPLSPGLWPLHPTEVGLDGRLFSCRVHRLHTRPAAGTAHQGQRRREEGELSYTDEIRVKVERKKKKWRAKGPACRS
jgi:hypothetical protein